MGACVVLYKCMFLLARHDTHYVHCIDFQRCWFCSCIPKVTATAASHLYADIQADSCFSVPATSALLLSLSIFFHSLFCLQPPPFFYFSFSAQHFSSLPPCGLKAEWSVIIKHINTASRTHIMLFNRTFARTAQGPGPTQSRSAANQIKEALLSPNRHAKHPVESTGREGDERGK